MTPFRLALLCALLTGALACDERAPDSEAAQTEAAPEVPRGEPETAHATEDEPALPPGTNPFDLPPETARLLRQEMLQLDTGMHTLHSALVRGDGDTAAETAQKIHDSFILKQELSKEELKALVAAVPEDFVERDRAFHKLSAELAEAARAGNFDDAAGLYGRMTDACVGCHTAHAPERFPALAP